MKKSAAVFVLFTLGMTATAAFAQANPFEGFYGQLSTGYENNSIKSPSTSYTVLDVPSFSGTQDTSNQTASGMPLVLGIGYNFAINGKWVLGLGADYSALSQKTSQFSSKNPQVPGPNGYVNGQSMEISNRFNIFLTPGYVIDQDKLVYAKIGYSNQQIQFTTPGTRDATGYSPSASQSGYVLGLGYKQVITGGLYVFGEANYMSYSHASLDSTVHLRAGPDISVNQNPSASAYTILVGAGYKF